MLGCIVPNEKRLGVEKYSDVGMRESTARISRRRGEADIANYSLIKQGAQRVRGENKTLIGLHRCLNTRTHINIRVILDD